MNDRPKRPGRSWWPFQNAEAPGQKLIGRVDSTDPGAIAQQEYRGHMIRVHKLPGDRARPYTTTVDAELLRGRARTACASTIDLALETGRAHVRKLNRVLLKPITLLMLEFRPEVHVANTPHGKYVICAMLKGRPIGGNPNVTHERDSFAPYYHPHTPAQGEPRCELLVGGAAACPTYEQARECCMVHARGLLAATAPTAPEAEA